MRREMARDDYENISKQVRIASYVVQVSSIDARALLVILGDLVRDGVVPAAVERLDLNQLRR
jgi:hypothetical protein